MLASNNVVGSGTADTAEMAARLLASIASNSAMDGMVSPRCTCQWRKSWPSTLPSKSESPLNSNDEPVPD